MNIETGKTDINAVVTVGELIRFKQELITEIKQLLKARSTVADKKWLKSVEVRKILDISSSKLLTLRINGTLPYTRIGGVIYYDQNDIDHMFSSRKFQHPA